MMDCSLSLEGQEKGKVREKAVARREQRSWAIVVGLFG